MQPRESARTELRVDVDPKHVPAGARALGQQAHHLAGPAARI
jgi:hypothetical protein